MGDVASKSVQTSCHCGAVRVEVAAPPETVTDCNCSICRRYGVLWAYYSPKDVQIFAASDATESYVWGDRDIEFRRCRTCGCVTHWAAFEKTYDRMGVNARLMDLDVVAAARVRKLDGAVTEKYVEDT
jgi:hypothetical protein